LGNILLLLILNCGPQDGHILLTGSLGEGHRAASLFPSKYFINA
jgi:hypothetical protein